MRDTMKNSRHTSSSAAKRARSASRADESDHQDKGRWSSRRKTEVAPLRVRQAWAGGSSNEDQGYRRNAPELGAPRIHVLLRREGWLVNHKRTERLYRMEGLNLRRNRPHRRNAVVNRGPSGVPTRRDERWSMDFMHDQLHDGRRLRVPTVVDQ